MLAINFNCLQALFLQQVPVTLRCTSTSLFNPDQHHRPISQLPLMWGWDWTSSCEGCKHFLIWGLSGNSPVVPHFQCLWSQSHNYTALLAFSSPATFFSGACFWLLDSSIHLPAAPLSSTPPFSLALVFVALIRLSLPQGPREQPQQSTAWKDRLHNPCYQGGCHLACRSTNSFNTMGAIVHLNIDFSPRYDLLHSYISLALAKRLHLLPDNAKCTHTTPALYLHGREGATWGGRESKPTRRGKQHSNFRKGHGTNRSCCTFTLHRKVMDAELTDIKGWRPARGRGISNKSYAKSRNASSQGIQQPVC